MMRKVQLANNQFYHVYNRGVEKRDIFLSEIDFSRFIFGLGAFNTNLPVNLKLYSSSPDLEIRRNFGIPHHPLVKVHSFCLLRNHYHVLLEQMVDNGISNFMKKLGVGYSMYFNMKHERVGPLFQGRFKAKFVDDEVYLTHVLRYIHLNPIEIIDPAWKESGIKSWKKSLEFLKSYKWSSYNDYSGMHIFPNVVTTDFLLNLLGGPDEHIHFLKSWLMKDLESIQNYTD